MTTIYDYKKTRAENVKKTIDICNDVLAELDDNIPKDSGMTFIWAFVATAIDSMGFICTSDTFYEAIAELAVIAQINDIDVTKVFSDCYGDVPPQELYEIYTKQRENVIADTAEA